MAESKGPIFGTQERNLGEQRLAEFVEHHGNVQAMAMFLLMSTMTVPQTGYSDEALGSLIGDADDLEKAAVDFAGWARRLAHDWRAQRQEMVDEAPGTLFTEAHVKDLLVTAINVERMGSPNVVDPLTAASLVLAAAKVPD